MRKRALDCGLGFPVLFSSLESGTPPGKDVICSRACPKPWLGDAGFSPEETSVCLIPLTTSSGRVR